MFNNSNMIAHIRTHTGKKPFICGTCNKAFAQSSALTIHMRVHNGDKPYKCEICNKAAFSQSDSLTKHMRTHSGSKSYVCTTCGQAFAVSGNLTTHMRTHSGDRPYPCTTCGQAFAVSSSLTKHVMTTHTDKNSSEYKIHCEKQNKRFRERYATDFEFRAKSQMRRDFDRFRNGKGKSGNTMALVGCTIEELILHLNNNTRGLIYGQKDLEIDHIRPMASFTLYDDPVQQHECLGFNNLQLLTREDNNAKSDYYDAEEYAKTPGAIAIAILRIGWEAKFASNSEMAGPGADEETEDESDGEFE